MGSFPQRLQELDHSICHRLSRFALNLSQEGQARLSLRQRDDCVTMSASNDRIHLPITQALASFHDSRPLVDAHPVPRWS